MHYLTARNIIVYIVLIVRYDSPIQVKRNQNSYYQSQVIRNNHEIRGL